MSDKTKKDAEPEELTDEALKEAQGGARTSTTTRTTIQTVVKPVVKPIGGTGQTPPFDFSFEINKTTK